MVREVKRTMARKEKLTLDYYPHYAVQGDISKIIQEQYGNDGYAVLYKNFEQFCLRDRQYIDLKEYVTLASISAYCKMSEEKYLEIVNTLVKLGAYDKDLWSEKKMLVSESFLENTKDAYKKRTTKMPEFKELKEILLISADGKAQTKTNKIKEKNIIPKLKEIEEYCKERGKGVDAVKFHDYYASRGWQMSCGIPLRDWKAAVRFWERNNTTKQTGMHYPTAEETRELIKEKREFQGSDMTESFKEIGKKLRGTNDKTA